MYKVALIDGPPQYISNINIGNTGFGTTTAAVTGISIQYLWKIAEFFIEAVTQALRPQWSWIAATGSSGKTGKQTRVP